MGKVMIKILKGSAVTQTLTLLPHPVCLARPVNFWSGMAHFSEPIFRCGLAYKLNACILIFSILIHV